MSILQLKSGDIVKDNYRICIDLDTLCTVHKFEDNRLVFHPCRLKAVNELYKNGHEIIITTVYSEDIIAPQISELNYHEIKYDFMNIDFYVSNRSRGNTSFFNELFDRNYEIKPLSWEITYK